MNRESNSRIQTQPHVLLRRHALSRKWFRSHLWHCKAVNSSLDGGGTRFLLKFQVVTSCNGVRIIFGNIKSLPRYEQETRPQASPAESLVLQGSEENPKSGFISKMDVATRKNARRNFILRRFSDDLLHTQSPTKSPTESQSPKSQTMSPAKASCDENSLARAAASRNHGPRSSRSCNRSNLPCVSFQGPHQETARQGPHGTSDRKSGARPPVVRKGDQRRHAARLCFTARRR